MERSRPDERASEPARHGPEARELGGSWAAGFLALSLGGLLALHFIEPQLGQSWSYAHLSRASWLPWLGALAVVSLPLLARALWARASARRELTPTTAVVGASFGLGVFAVLLVLAYFFPAPSTSLDAGLFLGWVSHSGDVARWHLLLRSYRLAVDAAAGVADPLTVVLVINSGMACIAITALVATARLLAQTRREAVALALLSLSTMGIAQLCVGYSDVYPLPLAAMATYVFCSLRAMSGHLHPFWPLVLVAVGPFFYVGLVLLAPSLAIVFGCELRRPGGPRRLAVGAGLAALLSGATTLPRFGEFFAWRAFLAAIDALPATHMGANATGYSLPLEQLLTLSRLEEVAHVLLLVDPVGWVLLLGTAAFAISRWRRDARWRRDEAPALAFLALLVVPSLVFVVVMEPLYGAYGDWDLFSYPAVGTAVLGGYAFVSWGRAFPKWFPWLLGLALACASVHLLARLNALDVEGERHRLESPSHIALAPPRE